MSDARRAFLLRSVALGAAGALVLAAPLTGAANAASGGARYAMIVDLNRCTGCGACAVACKLQNGTQQGQFLTRVLESEVEQGGRVKAAFLPTMCNQCENAPCIPACPTKATFALDNGVVVTDWDKCVGDGACVKACPYGARSLDTRFGKVDKCDFCQQRLSQGLTPACVENCPPKARIFGDLNAPKGEFGRLLTAGKLTPLKPELGLKPRVFYIKIS